MCPWVYNLIMLAILRHREALVARSWLRILAIISHINILPRLFIILKLWRVVMASLLTLTIIRTNHGLSRLRRIWIHHCKLVIIRLGAQICAEVIVETIRYLRKILILGAIAKIRSWSRWTRQIPPRTLWLARLTMDEDLFRRTPFPRETWL